MTVFMFALAIPYYHWRGTKCGGGFCAAITQPFSCSTPSPSSSPTLVQTPPLSSCRRKSSRQEFVQHATAAAGKAGAVTGALGFVYAAESTDIHEVYRGYHKGIGIKNTLMILGVTNALGMLCTFLIPETSGKSLEELSRENEEEKNTGIEVEHTHSTRRNVAPMKQLETLNLQVLSCMELLCQCLQ